MVEVVGRGGGWGRLKEAGGMLGECIGRREVVRRPFEGKT